MLLDKRRVSTFTKIGAAFLAVIFAISLMPAIISLVMGTNEMQRPSVTIPTPANPKDASSWVNLGNSYFDAGEQSRQAGKKEEAVRYWQNAVQAYQRALELNPDDVNARTDMAILYSRLGQLDKGIEEARKSTQIDPKHALSRFNLGVLLGQARKKQEAAVELQTFLKLDPKAPQAAEARKMLVELGQ